MGWSGEEASRATGRAWSRLETRTASLPLVLLLKCRVPLCESLGGAEPSIASAGGALGAGVSVGELRGPVCFLLCQVKPGHTQKGVRAEGRGHTCWWADGADSTGLRIRGRSVRLGKTPTRRRPGD